MRKKLILAAVSLLSLIIVINHEIVSSNDYLEYEADYNKLIEEGVISAEITLEQWTEAKKAEAEGLKWIEEEAERFERSQKELNTLSSED